MKKYILEILDENQKVITTSTFKSMKDLNKSLPQIEYHQLRAIYQQSYKPSKYLHPQLQQLYSKIRIKDSPDKILNYITLVENL
jgi:hypothetical protein